MADGEFDFWDYLLGRGQYGRDAAVDPTTGVSAADERASVFNTLGNVGGLLMAAGQPMTGADRARYLAMVPGAISQRGADLYDVAQRRREMADVERKRQAQAQLEQYISGMSKDQQILARLAPQQFVAGVMASQNRPNIRPPTPEERAQYGLKPEDKVAMVNGRPTSIGGGGQTFNLVPNLQQKIGESDVKNAEAAIKAGKSAVADLNLSNTIRQYLDEGVITGFGANQKVLFGQVKEALGLKADPKIARTRALMASLAKRALDAGQLMRGQGSITEGERATLKRAAGADAALGADAIRSVLDITDRVSRYELEQGKIASETLSKFRGKDSPFNVLSRIPDYTPYERTFDVNGEKVVGKLGSDGNYYTYKNGKRFRISE